MIALITPTGGRPYQFHLCSLYMKRQTYIGRVTWIIVDDCIPTTTDEVTEDFKDNWIINKIYPRPAWEIGQNSQARNISAGITHLKENYNMKDVEAIFIIEDDDYYKPTYLEKMIPKLNGFLVAGEINTIYYNVYYKRYVTNGNTTWSSLFQTAFTPEAIPTFKKCYDEKFIDYVFFRLIKNKNLINQIPLSIGIKGQPGRYGIGAGHQNQMNMNDDNDLQYLNKMIGSDAQYYDGSYRAKCLL